MQRGIATDLRWTWIFGTILILVVVVVIGFLSGITSALNSIDKALGTTDATLTDVGGDADPLPGYIKSIKSDSGDILGDSDAIKDTAACIDVNANLGNPKAPKADCVGKTP